MLHGSHVPCSFSGELAREKRWTFGSLGHPGVGEVRLERGRGRGRLSCVDNVWHPGCAIVRHRCDVKVSQCDDTTVRGHGGSTTSCILSCASKHLVMLLSGVGRSTIEPAGDNGIMNDARKAPINEAGWRTITTMDRQRADDVSRREKDVRMIEDDVSMMSMM